MFVCKKNLNSTPIDKNIQVVASLRNENYKIVFVKKITPIDKYIQVFEDKQEG